MSIADKLTAIAENTPKVYDQGYEDGKNSVSNPLEYARAIAESYQGVAFPDEYELTLNLPNVTSLNSAFYTATGIKKITIKGNNAGNTVVFNRAFRGVSSLETIDLTEFKAKFGGETTMMCFYNIALVEILGELDFSAVTGFLNAFAGCSNLVTFTPKANTIKLSINLQNSSKLSDKSAQSIIDGLADLTGSDTQTLTVHADVYEKIIANGWDALITAKNWTLVSA